MDKRLLDYAARLFGVDAAAILTNNVHLADVGRARAALIWVLLRTRPTWPQREIARAVGLSALKSVRNNERKADQLRTIDRAYQGKLDKLLLAAGRQEDIPPPPPQRPTLRITRQPDAMAIWGVQERRGIFVRTA